MAILRYKRVSVTLAAAFITLLALAIGLCVQYDNDTQVAEACPPTQYNLTMYVNDASGGTTFPSGSEQGSTYPYNVDTELTITATASSGWRFVEWESMSTPAVYPTGFNTASSSNTITMDQHYDLQAVFIEEFTLTTDVSPSSGGSVSPSGTTTYDDGDSVTVSATANAPNEFDEWTCAPSAPSGFDTSASSNTFDIDQDYTLTAVFVDPAPTVTTLDSSSSEPTNVSPIAMNLEFSESVTGLTEGEISTSNATVDTNSLSGSGAAYSFEITPTQDGSLSVSIPAGVAQDSGSNDNVASDTFTRTYDSTAPTVSMSSSTSESTNVSPIGVTVTFSEEISGFELSDITPGNGTTGNFAAQGDDKTFTFDLTPGAEGSVTADIAADVAQDAATNGNTVATQFVRTYDTTAPTVSSITRVNSTPTNAIGLNFEVIFDEPVTGVDTADFTLDYTGITSPSVTQVTGSGTTWTVTVATGTGDGSLSIDVESSASITDLAGNALVTAFTDGETYTIDKTAPSVSSIALGYRSPTNLSQVLFLVTFDEVVQDVDLSDFVIDASGVTDTGLMSVEAVDGIVWEVMAGTGAGDGTLSIDVDSGAGITDLAGNSFSGGFTNGASYTINRSFPSVQSIVRVHDDPTNRETVDFTVTFDKSVVDVEWDDFVVDATTITDASVTAVTGGNAVYTVTVDTGTGDGTVSIDTAAPTTIWDLVGNPHIVDFTDGETYTVDKTAPTVESITRVQTNPTKSQSLDFTVLFDEPVENVDVSDFVLDPTDITDASITGVTGADDTWTVTIDVGTGEGTLSIDLDATATINDEATNALTEIFTAGEVYTIDRTSPSVTMTSSASEPTNDDPIMVDVTFDEAVTGFDVFDVSAGNGSVGGFVDAEDGIHYSFELTPGSDGVVTADIGADGAQDTAGNLNTAATQFTRTYDGTPPTASLSSSSAVTTLDNPITVSVTFSEDIAGFTSGDVSADNGTVSNVVDLGTNRDFTFDVSPVADGTVSAYVVADGVQDTAGNGNIASDSLSRTYDSTAPTGSMSSSSNDPTFDAVIEVTLTYSESVTGFDGNDIVLGNATLGTITDLGNGTYTFEILPIAGGEVSADVVAGAVSDVAGNPSEAVGGFTRLYDAAPPAVVSIRPAEYAADADSVDFLVVFTEPVTGLATSDFWTDTTDFSGNTIPAYGAYVTDVSSVSGDPSCFIVSVNTGVGDKLLSINFLDDDGVTDLAGNPVGGTGIRNGDFVDGEYCKIDKIAPYVYALAPSDTLSTNAQEVRFGLTFSEPIEGLDLSDLELNATADEDAYIKSIVGDGVNFEVTVDTGTDDCQIALHLVDDDSIIDWAGNTLIGAGGADGSAWSTNWYSIYKTQPVCSFTASLLNGKDPLVVWFRDDSTTYGINTAWAWDFDNDGETDSTEQHPIYMYGTPGTYTVTLTITDVGGTDALTRTDYITVEDSEDPDHFEVDAHVNDGKGYLTPGGATSNDFASASLSDWQVISGTWDASLGYLRDTGSGLSCIAWPVTTRDVGILFSYETQDTSSTDYIAVINMRYKNADNRTVLEIGPNRMTLAEYYDGERLEMVSDTQTSSVTGTQYTVYIECKKNCIVVWRQASDGTWGDSMLNIVNSDFPSTVDSSSAVVFEVAANASFEFDDIEILTTTAHAFDDGDVDFTPTGFGDYVTDALYVNEQAQSSTTVATISDDGDVAASFTETSVLTMSVSGSYVDIEPGAVTSWPTDSVLELGVDSDCWTNTTADVLVNASSGYGLDGWTGDVIADGTVSRICMDQDKSVTALLDACATADGPGTSPGGPIQGLHLMALGGGVVNLAPYTSHSVGDDVEIIATPLPRYSFEGWVGDYTASLPARTITMDGDTATKHIAAVFRPYVPLVLNIVGDGSVLVYADSVYIGTYTKAMALCNYFPAGTVITLEAVPDDEGDRIQWTGDGDGSGDTLTLTLDGGGSCCGGGSGVTANIVPQITVSTSTDGNGSVVTDPVSPGSTVDEGSVFWIEAVPQPGWRFVQWIGSGVPPGQETLSAIQVDTSQNVSIIAVFSQYGDLTIDVVGDGVVNVDPPDEDYTAYSETFTLGQQVTATAKSSPGWAFNGWEGDVPDEVWPLTATPIDIEIDTDRAIVARFEQNPLSVTVTTTAENPTCTTTIPLTIHFSLPVPDFSPDDLTIANATVLEYSGSSTTYHVELLPIETGTVTVELMDNVIYDSDGYGNNRSNLFTIEYCQAIPDPPVTSYTYEATLLVDVEPATSSPGLVEVVPPGGQYATFEHTYSHGEDSATQTEPVERVSLVALPSEGWAFDHWDFHGKPFADNPYIDSADVDLRNDIVNGDLWLDSYHATAVFMNSGPDVVISTTEPDDPTCNDAIPMTVTFTEAVTGFTADALLLDNGSVENFSGSGTTYTFTLIPYEVGPVTVQVPNNVAYDIGGYPNNRSDEFTIDFELCAENTVQLFVTIVGRGQVEVSPDKAEYEQGDVITLTATPKNKWRFVEWTGDVTGTNSTASITVDGPNDIYITAYFIEQFRLHITETGRGTVSSDPDVDKVSFWDAGSVITLTATPNNGWTFKEWLEVSMEAGASETHEENPLVLVMDSSKHILSRFSSGPAAEFTASPQRGESPLNVQFTDASLDGKRTITSWAWDFDNDGTTDSTAQSPSHTFTTVGKYTVSLTVTSAAGTDTMTKTDYIAVDVLPTPDFTVSATSGIAPLSVTFTDSSAPGSEPITAWSWDFDGDSIADSTVQHPTYTYTTGGTYTVSLTVTTEAGVRTETKTDLIVVDELPSVQFSGTPVWGIAPVTVNFTDATDLGTGSNASWSWDFDNDSVVDSTVQNPSYTYTTPGTYSVGLTVTTTVGSHALVKGSYVTVESLPTAAFTTSTSVGPNPLQVSFTDQSDPGTGTITGWAWDFDNDSVTDSTAQNPTYTYTTAGTYTVSLTVTTAVGSDTETKTDLVRSEVAPTADFSASPLSGNGPLAVSFTDTSNAGGGAITAWSWDFDNDGTADSTSQNPSHIYTFTGVYTVSLTVTNSAGTDTTSKTDYIDLIDGLPAPLSIVRYDSNPTSEQYVEFWITFSEAMKGVDPTDFVVQSSGLTGAYIDSVNTPSSEYERHYKIKAYTGSGDGTLGIQLIDDDTIVDDDLEPIGGVGTGNANYTSDEVYTVDKTAPTVTVTGPASPTTTSPMAFTATFTEDMTGLDITDVVCSGGTVQNFASVNASTYTFEVVPSGDGTVTVDIPADSAEDPAANGNVAASQFSVLYDCSAPGVSMTAPTEDPTNDSPVTIPVSFTESVTGFTSTDITVTNGTVQSVSGSGDTYSVDVAPAGDGIVTVDIPADGAVDAAGNGNTAATGISFTYDATAPVPTIDEPAAAYTNETPITVSVTFSESVTGFALTDIVPTNATTQNLSGSGNSYTFELVPTSDGTVTASLSADSVQDAAGNANTTSASYEVVYDSAEPGVSMDGPASDPTHQSPVAITVTFTESVTGFEVTDLTLGNATAQNLAGSGANYTFDVVATADGTVTVDIPAAVAQDTAGNDNTAATQVSFGYDGTVPTVSVTTTADDPTNTGVLTMDVVFSESVTGFELTDIVTSNGTAQNLTGSGTTYAFELVPVTDGAVSASVPADSATDSAGNGNSASSACSVVYDATAPDVSMDGPASDPTNDNPVQITVTFTEPVTGFVLGDITATNATAQNLSGSGASYTFELVPTADGTVTADITADVAEDTAGNTNTAATQYNVSYDGTAPAVSMTAPDDPTNDSPVTIPVTFTESVTGFALTDITVTNGTAQNLTGSGDSYSFEVVPTADGTVTVDIGANAADDTAGNGNTAAPQVSFAYDGTTPGVSMTDSENDPTNTSPITVDVAFTESVTGFDLTDITVVNGTAQNLTGSDDTYAFELVPTTDGTVTADIGADVAMDASGNGNAVATQYSVTYDATSPDVSMTGPASLTNDNPATVSVTFTESVTGFTLADVSVTNGTAQNLSGSDAAYTFEVVPAADGTVTVDIAADGAQDAAGNGNTAATQLSFTYDGTVPTVSMGTPASNPLSTNPITIPVTFSETVTGFDLSDVVVSNATAQNLTGAGASYSFELALTGDGTVTADIPANSAQDAAGNDNTAATQYSVTYDGTQPSVTAVTRADTTPTNATSVDFTVTFSESVTGVGTGDIVIDAASTATSAAVDSVTGSGATWTVTVTTGAVDGTVSIDVVDSDTSITDAAGNTLSGSYTNGETYTVDKTAPTVSVTGPVGTTNDSPMTIDAVFSENVTGFALTDITVSNGSAQNLTGSGDTYVFEVTATTDGPVTVDIAADGVQDAAGNGNTAATQYSVTYDGTAPEVSLTPPDDPTNDDPITIAVTFTESVTGFALGDIVATNATAQNLTGSGASYSFELVPTADGTVTATIPANSAQDTAGSPNEAATPISFTYDGTSPTVSMTSTVDDPTNESTITVAVSFSESVTGLTLGDITVSNATAQNLTGSDDTYSFDLLPTSDGTVTADIAVDIAEDAAGNLNTAATQYSVTYDATAPDVSMSQPDDPTNDNPVTVTVTFTESVTGFTLGDITASNATAQNLTGSDDTYSFELVPTADGTVTVDIAADTAEDDAGNGCTAATQVSFMYDGTSASCTAIALGDADPTNAASVTFDVTFDESVSGVALTDFVIDAGSTATNASLDSVTGSGTSWTVTVLTGSVDGTLKINLVDGDGSIEDGAGNGLSASFTTGDTYTVDKTAPTVQSLVRTGQEYSGASVVDFTITFSEPVANLNAGDFVITGATEVSNASIAGVTDLGNGVFTVTVNTGTGDGLLGIAFADDDGVSDAAGNPVGGVGLDNGSYTGTETYSVDKTAPSVQSVVRETPATSDTNDETVTFTVTFSESVTGVNTADFVVGAVTEVSNASIVSVSGAGTAWSVAVDTGTGDGLLGLDFVDDDSVLDVAGNPVGGSGTSNGNATGDETYLMDHTAPAVLGITLLDDTTTGNQTVGFRVTFSEEVSGFDTVSYSDFLPVASGDLTGPSVAGLSGTGSVFDVSVDTGTGNGLLSLTVLSGGTIQDAAGNTLAQGYVGSATYAVVKAALSSSPDLYVGAVINAPPPKLKPDQAFTVQCDVMNWSSSSTGATSWYDALVLSRDDTFDAGDKELVRVAGQSVAAQTAYTQSLSVTAFPDVAPGLYYLIVVLDVDGDFTEDREGDNLKTFSATVLIPEMTNE